MIVAMVRGETMKFGIFNETNLDREQLRDLVEDCLCKGLPDFYVIVHNKDKDGCCITNLDRPTIIIAFKDEEQFKKVLKHEFIHLIQHSKGYADEFETALLSKKTIRTCVNCGGRLESDVVYQYEENGKFLDFCCYECREKFIESKTGVK